MKLLFKLILIVILLTQGIILKSQTAICTNTSVGLTPINDLGKGKWNGFIGGLYPNGSNSLPAAHLNAGLKFAKQIQPLDINGNPNPDGKIVFISIGLSNTTQEFSAFVPMGNSDSNKNPEVTIVDCAQGAQAAQNISNPASPYWTYVSGKLSSARVTHQQVQAIWYKEANPVGNNGPTPQVYSDSLKAQSKRIMNIIKTTFPNVKICYIASRIYGGYASTNLNPEPYAYWQGWSMKWLIEDQINKDPKLEYSGTNANSPWLCWGSYIWADGLIARSDGLTWICPDDFKDDGTHPSKTGQQKVAKILLNFMNSDTTTCWYRLKGCIQ